MSETDSSGGQTPYSPSTATSRVGIYSVKEQLWDLEEKIRDAHDPVVKYDLIKQAGFLMCGLGKALKRPTGISPQDFEKDMADIRNIRDQLAKDEVPDPVTPLVQPLAFRHGLPQYDIMRGDVTVGMAFGPDLKTVAVDIVLESDRRRAAKAGVSRIFPLWSDLHGYMAKYGQWDFTTRIAKEETGYDAARRRANLQNLQSLRGTTVTPSDDDERT